MNAITVRRLLVDLELGFDPLWNGGDALRTHCYNALSMSFPVGEQFFIDSVRAALPRLPEAVRQSCQGEVQAFIGQEAIHRHVHGLYNAELERQGLRNHWARWAGWRVERVGRLDPLHRLAITAAYEHFTAVLARAQLEHPGWMAGAQPELALVWCWHAVEETEHKAVAFDVYCAAGGSYRRRAAWFVWCSLLFAVEFTLQTLSNLRRSGHLWQWRTWRGAWALFLGPEGMMRAAAGPLAAYLARDFHPTQHDASHLAAEWVRTNAAYLRPLAGLASGPATVD